MPDRERDTVAPAFEIFVNGNRLPPEAATDLFLLEVTDDLDGVGMFALSLNAGDPRSLGTKWIDTNEFREGNKVTVKMGFHAPLPDVMSGEITGLEPEFPERGPLVLTVRGYDPLYRLALGRKTRSFRNMKDSDIAAQIANDWTLSPAVEDTTVTHEYVFQNNRTDLEFLLERARRIGYEVKAEDGHLAFRRRRESGTAVASLAYGEGLLSFAPRLSLVMQASEVVVQGWDARDKREMRGRAGAGDEASRMGGTDTGATLVQGLVGATPLVVVGEPPATPEDAESMARGRFNLMAFDLVRGEARCMGDPRIRAGVVVELREIGRRFSGRYYVTSVTHTLSTRRGYVTTFGVERSAA